MWRITVCHGQQVLGNTQHACSFVPSIAYFSVQNQVFFLILKIVKETYFFLTEGSIVDKINNISKQYSVSIIFGGIFLHIGDIFKYRRDVQNSTGFHS